MSLTPGRYPLTGARAATTAPQEAFIARAREVLEADDRVLAAYLVGGFAVGIGDAFSDVDLQALVTEESAEELAEGWIELIHRITPTVNVQAFPTLNPAAPRQPPNNGGGVCITPEWLHFDVVFRVAGSIDAHAIEGMVPLFDKAGLLPAQPTTRPDRRGDPFYPEGTVSFFLYMLGNVVAAIGRDEPVPASNGVIMMRDIGLVRLFLAEQGLQSTRDNPVPGMFPFTKRLRRYLTEEQHAILVALPPLSPSLDSAIDGFVALAEVFLPRAKRLAVACGAPWPEDYAQASVAHFERAVGTTINL
jgi:hypothetical protein